MNTNTSPTIQQAVERFFENFDFGKERSRTERSYRSGANVFLKFVDDHGALSLEQPLNTMTAPVVGDFDRWMREAEHQGPGPRAGSQEEKKRQGYSAATRQLYSAALKRMLQYWWYRDWLSFSEEDVDDARKATMVQSQRAPREASSRNASVPADFGDHMLATAEALPYPEDGSISDAVALRLAQLETLRARAIVHVARATALRVSDLVRLNRTDVQMAKQANGHLQVTMQKTGLQAYVYMGEATFSAINDYLELRRDLSPWLFIQHGRFGKLGKKQIPAANKYEQLDGKRGYGYPLGEGSMRRIVITLAKKAGYKPGPKEFVSIHAFRHWHAQRLMDAGASIDQVQSVLGHARAETTKDVYAPKPNVVQLLELEKAIQ